MLTVIAVAVIAPVASGWPTETTQRPTFTTEGLAFSDFVYVVEELVVTDTGLVVGDAVAVPDEEVVLGPKLIESTVNPIPDTDVTLPVAPKPPGPPESPPGLSPRWSTPDPPSGARLGAPDGGVPPRAPDPRPRPKPRTQVPSTGSLIRTLAAATGLPTVGVTGAALVLDRAGIATTHEPTLTAELAALTS